MADALGGLATSVYDAARQLQYAKDEAGTITSYAYDSQGRQTKVIEAYGSSVQRTATLLGWFKQGEPSFRLVAASIVYEQKQDGEPIAPAITEQLPLAWAGSSAEATMVPLFLLMRAPIRPLVAACWAAALIS